MSESQRHRWSGWPGAWCLDCGREDPYEQALADKRIDCDAYGHLMISPELHAELQTQMVCPEPGSKRHDPYARAATERNRNAD